MAHAKATGMGLPVPAVSGVVEDNQHKCPNCPTIIKDPALQVRIVPDSKIKFSRLCSSCKTRIYYLIISKNTGGESKVVVYFSVEKGATGG
jgi:hypothetical protein